MELLCLLLLYLIAQNPDFPQKLSPVLQNLKNSEEALRFLKDLSDFSCSFKPKDESAPPEEKEKSQSPTDGIANEFIEKILNDYLKR